MIIAVVTWLAEDWADALHVLLSGHGSGRIIPFAASELPVDQVRVALSALPGSWVREGADVAIGELRSLVRPGLPLPGLLLPISIEPASPVAVWVQALPIGMVPKVAEGDSTMDSALRELAAAVSAAARRDHVVMVPLLLDGELVIRGAGEGSMAPTLLIPRITEPLP